MGVKLQERPKGEKKRILLICDDIRVHSGVATVAKEVVINTSHLYEWVNLAGAIKHPEKGKRFDLSQSIKGAWGDYYKKVKEDIRNSEGQLIDITEDPILKDCYIQVVPTDGYGNAEIVRNLLKEFKPDAIMLFTDPRYFTWVFQMEDEIRKKIPIFYLNIWDSPLPVPMYNFPYYDACDLLMGISKQTVNINKLVLGDKAKDKVIKYVPHGLNEQIYKPLPRTDAKLQEFRKNILGGKEADFVLFFNSRNIRRKQIPDAMLAFRDFLWSLPEEKARKCFFVLHTEPSSDHGTDLVACRENFFGPKYDLDTGERLTEETFEDQVIFSTKKYPSHELNLLYNFSDAQILLTSNEGWGLTITEAILCGNPIIANVQGGMQDQMRFEDDNGDWIDFNRKFLSNHYGTYKKHGEWAFPCYPTSRSIQGSPQTPYIADSRCKWEDAADQIKKLYDMTPEQREEAGRKGREWAISQEAGFTSFHQAIRVQEAFDEAFENFVPKGERELDIENATKFTGRHINHAIRY